MNSRKDFESQLPLLLRVFENSLRSGYSIRQSLEIIAQELPAPASEQVQQTVDELAANTPMPEALEHWLQRMPSPDLDLVIATIHVQRESGGNLADKFNLLAQIMAKRTL